MGSTDAIWGLEADPFLSHGAVPPQGLCPACPWFTPGLAVSPSLLGLPFVVRAACTCPRPCSLGTGGEGPPAPPLGHRVCGCFLSIVANLNLQLHGHPCSWRASRARNSQRAAREDPFRQGGCAALLCSL